MNIVIVCKPPYSLHLDHGGRSIPVHLTMAGHTVQLIRPLVEGLLDRAHNIALVFPLRRADDEASIFDLNDQIPDHIRCIPYEAQAIPKTIHSTATLELNAAILAASHALGAVDWVLFINAFPTLPLAYPSIQLLQDKSQGSMRVAVFLRGGDAYKWTDMSFLSQSITNPVFAPHMHELYMRSLRAADFIGVASAWLRERLDSVGLTGATIVPSPPIPRSSNTPGTDKRRLLRLRPHFGRLDPACCWLLVSGRIHADKRPDIALQAFLAAKLDSWQLVYAGAGDFASLERLVILKAPSERGRIAAITVPPRLLPHLYNSADAVLHTSMPSPTFTDARPSALTSAAYHKKPVVAILGGGVAECLSVENIEQLCAHPLSHESAEMTVRHLARLLERLRQEPLRRSIGQANALHTDKQGVNGVIHDVIAILERRVGDV